MDLYMQIGVILLLLTAFSLYIYMYTQPIDNFSSNVAEMGEQVNTRLATLEDAELAPFLSNVSATGSSLYQMIRNSKELEIAVLVQTKNQQGLIVNYGYQLRDPNVNDTLLAPYGYASSSYVTDFEKNYVSFAKEVFLPSGTANATVGTGYPSTASLTNGAAYIVAHTVPPSANTGTLIKSPRLMFYNPMLIGNEATAKAQTYMATGNIYTDQTLLTSADANMNFSYMDNPNTVYYFDKNASYYVTTILDKNMELVGLYVEEHGIKPEGAVLGGMMKHAGLISQLY